MVKILWQVATCQVAAWQLAIGNWQLAIGNCQLAIPNQQLPIGNSQLAIPNSNSQLGIASWQLPISNCQLAIANWQLPISNCQVATWQVATCQVATSQDATKNHENIENGLKWAQIGAPELGIMPTGSKKYGKTRGDIRLGQKQLFCMEKRSKNIGFFRQNFVRISLKFR